MRAYSKFRLGGFEGSISDEVGGGTEDIQVVFSPEEEGAAKGPRVLRVPEEEVVTSVGLQIGERNLQGL